MAFQFLLPLLFSAGSALANTIASNQQDKAMAAVQDAERIRQNELDKQAFALNDQSAQRYEQGPEQVDTTASNLADMYKAALAQPAAAEAVAALPQSDSNVVVTRDAQAGADAADRAARDAQRLAGVRAFGDFMGTAGRGQARDAAELGTIASFKRGSQSVMPLEMQAAQEKGSGLRTLADLLSMGSMVTGMGVGGGNVLTDGIAGMFQRAPQAGTLIRGKDLLGANWTGAY